VGEAGEVEGEVAEGALRHPLETEAVERGVAVVGQGAAAAVAVVAAVVAAAVVVAAAAAAVVRWLMLRQVVAAVAVVVVMVVVKVVVVVNPLRWLVRHTRRGFLLKRSNG